MRWRRVKRIVPLNSGTTSVTRSVMNSIRRSAATDSQNVPRSISVLELLHGIKGEAVEGRVGFLARPNDMRGHFQRPFPEQPQPRVERGADLEDAGRGNTDAYVGKIHQVPGSQDEVAAGIVDFHDVVMAPPGGQI